MTLKAPFPWFGGKSRAAHLIWPRFGDVPNYIEPFAGSLAVLLARQSEPRVETVNDKDCYLVNFWRAVQANPEAVASYADSPVNEAELHARHRWLVTSGRRLAIRCTHDPHYFNPKVAGWWVYGQCLWIGSGWCARPEWTGRTNAGRAACGVATELGWNKRPVLHAEGARGVIGAPADRGVNTDEYHNRPDLSSAHGRGIAGLSIQRRWNSGGAGAGQGVHAPALTRQQVPDLSGSRGATGRGIHATDFERRSEGLYAYMQALQVRLRRVRVCCGDWRRVLTSAVTTHIGITGVLLDPPYSHAERSICYTHDEDISAAVRQWALEHGEDQDFRIALCGYEGEHEMPDPWECVSWMAGGGYGRTERGKKNRYRERIWFSPHCLKDPPPLFSGSDQRVEAVS